MRPAPDRRDRRPGEVTADDCRTAAPRADPDARGSSSTPRPWSGPSRPAAGAGTTPPWRRVELRYVDLKAGRHLQVTAYDDTPGAHLQPRARRRRPATPSTTCSTSRSATGTSTPPRETAPAAGDQEGRGAACTPPRARGRGRRSTADHDRDKGRLLAEDDPVFVALGLSDHEGRMKPSRQAKYRQVEEFLRILDASITDAIDKGHLRRPTAERAAADRRPRLRQRLPDLRRRSATSPTCAACRSQLTGVDVQRAVARPQHRGRRRARRRRRPSCVGGIAAAELDRRARRGARAARLRHRHRRRAGPGGRVGGARWCWPRRAATTTSPRSCARTPTPAPYAMLTRHGILRERFADTLTDALRASLLRLQGYRVDVMQFVESKHTPRNTLLRAVRTGRPGHGRRRPHGVRRAGRDLGGPAAAGASCWSDAMRERYLLGLRRSRSWSAALAAGRAARRRRRSSRFAGPGDRRVQRAGRSQDGLLRHHQRLRRHRPGLHRRPGDRARPSA